MITVLAIVFQIDVRRVGDLGSLPDSLPVFLWPQVPLTLETLRIVLPYSLGLAAVGLLESWMTAQIVDELTDTPSDKNRESLGQGLANFVSGLFGGMAGCAMIGQSVINVKSGGRGRLSTLLAGVFLLVMIVLLGPWVKQIPMPALVAVMIMVSIGTFSWASFKNLKLHPRSSSIVMLATTATVVLTHNLAIGVGVGVLLSALFFARKVSQVLRVTSELEWLPMKAVTAGVPDENAEPPIPQPCRAYTVSGQLFFASADAFVREFDFKEVLAKVRIDVTHAHFWDLTAVASLDKVVLKFRREGTEVELIGLNEASATIVDRLGIHDKPDALERLLAH